MDANGQDNAITTESYRLSSNYQHVYKQDNIVDVTIRSIVRTDPPCGTIYQFIMIYRLVRIEKRSERRLYFRFSFRRF